jgi:hypothetical protein
LVREELDTLPYAEKRDACLHNDDFADRGRPVTDQQQSVVSGRLRRAAVANRARHSAGVARDDAAAFRCRHPGGRHDGNIGDECHP